MNDTTLPLEVKGTDTRARLIEVAAVLFAEHGFNGASVRDICERAEANPASINYHFGSKFELYKRIPFVNQQSKILSAETRLTSLKE